jgi:GTP-binding protein
MSLPVVAIVGRPNVGKSTLFNRIVGKRDAVVDDLPGVTRDRKYAEAEWAGVGFLLADTGGFVPQSVRGIEASVRRQVELAIADSDIVIFLADADEGLHPVEKEIASRLRKAGKSTILVVNKVDGARDRRAVNQFFELGVGEPFAVSATHGLGIGDLLDMVVGRLPKEKPRRGDLGLRIAVVGRPNVGKSSFVNCLVKEERLVVDEKPGTTRDSVDTALYVNGKKVVLVDTAGLRKRTKVRESIEFFSTIRSVRSMQESSVTILITDASEGPTKQDKRIAASSKEYGKCLVVVANKTDLLTGVEKKEMKRSYREEFVFAPYAPVVPTSALTGEGVEKALELALYAAAEGKRRVAKTRLSEAVKAAVGRSKPPSHGGKWIRIYGCEQKGVLPPRFVLFSNEPRGLGKDYLRYLEKNLRKEFGFRGTPIMIGVTRRR